MMTDHPEPRSPVVVPSADGRRRRGDRSRAAVLEHAVQRASVEGLAGLTFGSLATSTGATKSAIAGLFGNKGGFELALVEHARAVFLDAVVAPARAASPPGLDRVWALTRRWSDYSRDRVFAGGCFFRKVEAELDSRDGPVPDAVVGVREEWDGYLAYHVGLAASAGDLHADTDPAQVVFEIGAVLGAANDRSVLLGTPDAYERALAAARTLLGGHGADPGRLA